MGIAVRSFMGSLCLPHPHLHTNKLFASGNKPNTNWASKEFSIWRNCLVTACSMAFVFSYGLVSNCIFGQGTWELNQLLGLEWQVLSLSKGCKCSGYLINCARLWYVRNFTTQWQREYHWPVVLIAFIFSIKYFIVFLIQKVCGINCWCCSSGSYKYRI